MLSMSGLLSFDLPPGYQFDPFSLLSILLSVDPALTLLALKQLETLKLTFELIFTLIQPLRCVCTSNRKTKKMKPKSESIGPFNISFNIAWIDFLRLMAKKIGVECSDLLLATFEWHWVKPINGPWLPAQDKNGFMSMVKKIKAKYKVNTKTVMFHMHAPSKNQSLASLRSAQDIKEESNLEELVAKKVCCILISIFILFISLADEAEQCAQGDHCKTDGQISSRTMSPSF
jgi:hypothetical protein